MNNCPGCGVKMENADSACEQCAMESGMCRICAAEMDMDHGTLCACCAAEHAMAAVEYYREV